MTDTNDFLEAPVPTLEQLSDRATLHQITNVLVDLDGDEAAIGAAVTATFADDGATGGRYELAARRTTAGWRLTAVGMRPVYRRGV